MAANSFSVGTFGWKQRKSRSVGVYGWSGVSVLAPPDVPRTGGNGFAQIGTQRHPPVAVPEFRSMVTRGADEDVAIALALLLLEENL